MPNSNTFSILPIKELIKSYVPKGGIVLDPFANEHSIKSVFGGSRYISNDLDNEYKCDYNLEANDFLKLFDDNSVDMVLYDPPYTPRQVSECYKKLDKTVTISDTQASYWANFKKQISRVLKPNGICISFGWNTNGIGMNNHMEIIKILIVAHGGSKNDTLVTVEKKNVSPRIIRIGGGK
jgi:DNA modification methylase